MRLTTTAAELISTLTKEADLPEGGLRIAQKDQSPGLTMELAPEPAGEDDVLRRHGVTVFLDSVAVERLQDEVLNARTNEAGSAFFLE
ncbi:MAG: adhesin [Frankiales bacterium]|nr:adhesin [Frankiales bacterium]